MISPATSHAFMEEAQALQTKLTHERSWRVAVESEVKVLQRILLALHAIIQRQSILLQPVRLEATARLDSTERKVPLSASPNLSCC
jgi:hypothetical protein